MQINTVQTVPKVNNPFCNIDQENTGAPIHEFKKKKVGVWPKCLSHLNTMLWEAGNTSCVGCVGGLSHVWLPADTRGVQVQGVQTPLRATRSPLFIKLQNEAVRGSLAKHEAGGTGTMVPRARDAG